MGCGNSREVSSGILVNAPSKNIRLWVHPTRGENDNRESRIGAARAQQAAVLLPTPMSAPGDGAPPSPPLSSAPGKVCRLTGCFLQGGKRVTATHPQLWLSFPNQQREMEKSAASPYLIVRVWNWGRTLHLLGCKRSKERSSLVMQVVFCGDDPRAMHTMGQLAWLCYELRAAAGRMQDHLGRNQIALSKGKFLAFPVVKKYVKTRRPCKHKPRSQLHRKPLTRHSSRPHPRQEGSPEQQMRQAGASLGKVWEAWGEQRRLCH